MDRFDLFFTRTSSYFANSLAIIPSSRSEKRLQDVSLAMSAPAPEEIIAMTRRSPDPSSEMAAAAPPALFDEIVIAAGPTEPENTNLAEDAVAAWQPSSKPSANVWLAGIQAWQGFKDQKIIDQEMAKLRRAYPEIQDLDELGTQQVNEPKHAAGGMASNDSEAANDIASAWAWAAGIDHIFENKDAERAENETGKFLNIYPGAKR
jgi:hypothetical protein